MTDRPRSRPAPPSVTGTDGSAGVATAPAPAAQAIRDTGDAIWAVIFAGGIGSRFWPLSSPSRPKQVLSLLGDRPLIADTVARLQPLVPPERVLVLTSRDIAPIIHDAIPEVPAANMLVEPRPLGTAAALAWGAHEVARRGGDHATCVAMHADLASAFPQLFRDAVRRAGSLAAKHHALVAIAVPPTRPEPAFGYVSPGLGLEDQPPVSDGGAAWAASFVEKPAPLLAADLIAGGALWFSGILVAEAKTMLDGLREHAVELREGLDALAANDAETFAGRIREVSLERGLLERSDRLMIVGGDFGWDDVGTWACLRRARDLDDDGNGIIGTVHCVEATSNVVHSEASRVVLYGVSHMLVVSLNGLTFVTTLERAKDLRPLLDALPGSLRMQPTA